MTFKKQHTLIFLLLIFFLLSNRLCLAIDMTLFYSPLVTGDNSWSYRVTEGDSLYFETFSTLTEQEDVNGTIVKVLEVTKNGTSEYSRYLYSQDSDGFYYHGVLIKGNSENSGEFYQSYIFMPPVKRYNPDEAVGTQLFSQGEVDYSYTDSEIDQHETLSYNSLTEVVGFEPIESYTGMVNAMKSYTEVEISGMVNGVQTTRTNRLTQWFAPLKGILKSVNEKTDGSLIYRELISDNCSIQDISPEVMLNGSEGGLIIPSSSSLSLSVALEDGNFTGMLGDYWIVADAGPLGLFSYVYPSGWALGIFPAIQWPIFSFSASEVFYGPLPDGDYTFYFGIDLNPDGIINYPLWFDEASLKVNCTDDIVLPVSREAAINKVLTEILTEPQDGYVVARMPDFSLEPGDVISSAFSDNGTGRTSVDPEWFVFIDDSPYAFFSHSVRYVFINRVDASVEVLKGDEVPYINGIPVWESPEDFEDESYWIYDNLSKSEKKFFYSSSEPLCLKSGFANSGFNPFRKGGDDGAEDDCCEGKTKKKIALILYNFDQGPLRNDIGENVLGMAEAFRKNGFTVPVFESSKGDGKELPAIYLGDSHGVGLQQLRNFIEDNSGPDHCCDEVFIYYSGHGNRGTVKGERRYWFGLRFSYRGENKQRIGKERLYAEDFAEILSGLGSCHINVIIDSCHSGGFIPGLSSLKGVETVRTSVNENEEAYSGYYDDVVVKDVTFTDPYGQPEGEQGSEFTSGYIKALNDRAQTDNTAISAKELTEIGFAFAVANDVVAISGQTHPLSYTRENPCDCCDGSDDGGDTCDPVVIPEMTAPAKFSKEDGSSGNPLVPGTSDGTHLKIKAGERVMVEVPVDEHARKVTVQLCTNGGLDAYGDPITKTRDEKESTVTFLTPAISKKGFY